MKWLDREMITGPYLALATSEADFHKAIRHLKVFSKGQAGRPFMPGTAIGQSMYADKQSSYGVVGQAGAAGYSTPMTADAAGRQPEVLAELDRLELATETLGKFAEMLTSRLETVRSQTGSGEKTAGAAPEPVLCNYAQAIRSQRQRVEGVSQMLQRALNELEI